MYCINPNTPQYQEILKEVGGNPLTANEIYRQRYLKDGVDDVFEQNTKLSSIGTPEEYSSYLNTIFPDSVVKDIVYHGSKEKNIDKFKTEGSLDNVGKYGAMFGSINAAKLRVSNLNDSRIYPVILNLQNPKNFGNLQVFNEIDYNNVYKSLNKTAKEGWKEEGFDGLLIDYRNSKSDLEIMQRVKIYDYLGDEYVVFDPEQIHILGGKEDLEGFQRYLENQRVEDKRMTPEKIELLAMARENLSEEEASIVENILNGDENFTDLSNFTCS